MAKGHSFRSFSAAELSATCTQWRGDVKKGIAFPADVEQGLNWAQVNSDPQNGDSQAFGIFEDGKSVAEAICEVVITPGVQKNSPWIKLLRVRLKPTLEEAIYANDLKAQRQALDIFVEAVGGVVDLTGVHAAKTLKVFGRSNEQLGFLKSFALHWQKEPERTKRTKVSIEGRWLVIKV